MVLVMMSVGGLTEMWFVFVLIKSTKLFGRFACFKLAPVKRLLEIKNFVQFQAFRSRWKLSGLSALLKVFFFREIICDKLLEIEVKMIPTKSLSCLTHLEFRCDDKVNMMIMIKFCLCSKQNVLSCAVLWDYRLSHFRQYNSTWMANIKTKSWLSSACIL